ncbi:MAG: V-type ATP synthase subunit F [Coriobacteriia bacterium]
MYKLIVLTDQDTADGFGLAGVNVVVADGPDDARRRLSALIDDDESGIVAVNEAFLAEVDERTQQKINQSYRPIVISLPIREQLATEEDHRAYLSRLIRRAIGFDITLRRG